MRQAGRRSGKLQVASYAGVRALSAAVRPHSARARFERGAHPKGEVRRLYQHPYRLGALGIGFPTVLYLAWWPLSPILLGHEA